MPPATTKSPALKGFVDGLPFIFAAGPFGLVFGVAAAEAGFDLAALMTMTVLVFAGAAQFTALAQMDQAAPVALVILAGLAVNLRMAMYSASIAPYLIETPLWKRAFISYLLVDNTYATGIAQFEGKPDMRPRDRLSYFVASAIPVAIVWTAASFIGAALGARIPASVPIDFAIPIAFLAIVAPMLKSLAHVAAALTSIVAALALSGLPFNSGLLIAAGMAMVVGVQVERRMA